MQMPFSALQSLYHKEKNGITFSFIEMTLRYSEQRPAFNQKRLRIMIKGAIMMKEQKSEEGARKTGCAIAHVNRIKVEMRLKTGNEDRSVQNYGKVD